MEKWGRREEGLGPALFPVLTASHTWSGIFPGLGDKLMSRLSPL